MNEPESYLKPLVLDVLDLVRRTQAIARVGAAAVDSAAVIQANQLVRAALGMLPDLEPEVEVDDVAPALPSRAFYEPRGELDREPVHDAVYEPAEESAEAPMDGWLLDDEEDRGFLDQG